jgi:tripartite ATP-independent transporter DctP family solute receptor
MQLLKTIFITGIIPVLLFSCNTTEQKKVLKLAHGLDQKHSVHLGMKYMAKRLEEISGGKMTIDVYPGGQLGSETQNIELLQIGGLAMTKVSSASLEGFVEEYKVFGIPYVIKSKEHLFRVLDSPVGRELKTSTEKYLFRGLGFYDAGARSFYTVKKAVLKPEDLAGQKIRVMKSPVAVAMMQAFGGSATPISWGELYTALQSGVVDGAENNLPSFVTSYHHEVSKHFTVNEHTMLPDVLIISKVVWGKLSPQEREWLEKAVQESVIYQRKLWEEQELESFEEAKSKGVNFYYPDKKMFSDKVASMRDMFKSNERVYRMIERIDGIAREMESENMLNSNNQ